MTPEEKERIKEYIVAIIGVGLVLLVGYLVIIHTVQHQLAIHCINNLINCSNITVVGLV